MQQGYGYILTGGPSYHYWRDFISGVASDLLIAYAVTLIFVVVLILAWGERRHQQRTHLKDMHDLELTHAENMFELETARLKGSPKLAAK